MMKPNFEAARYEEIQNHLEEVRREIPSNCTLIVVTKTFPVSDLEILYDLGERNFGENRISEGAEKSHLIADDVIWHFQGQIQSNKIRSLVSWVDVIHSLDDLSHAKKIEALATESSRRIKAFIQINLDSDPNGRGGIAPDSVEEFLEELTSITAPDRSLEIIGVMGIAPLNEDPAPAFARLQEISHQVRALIPGATSISAGMSGDFKVALRYGATHLRIGSSILGTR